MSSTQKKTKSAPKRAKKRPICCWVSESTALRIKAHAAAQERKVAWVVERILEKSFPEVL